MSSQLLDKESSMENETRRLVPQGPATFKMVVSVVLLAFTWWGLYLIVSEIGFNKDLWLLSEQSCSGAPGLCGYKIAGYVLSVVFIFPHLGEADMFRKVIGPAASAKGLAPPTMNNIAKKFGIDGDAVILRELRKRLVNHRFIGGQVFDGILVMCFFVFIMLPIYLIGFVVIFLLVSIGFPILLLTGQMSIIRSITYTMATNYASIASAMDQLLTVTLLVLSYAVILTSGAVSDVLVNVVAVIVFAELDDQLVEMFYHRLTRMKDKLVMYKIVDEDDDLAELLESEMVARGV